MQPCSDRSWPGLGELPGAMFSAELQWELARLETSLQQETELDLVPDLLAPPRYPTGKRTNQGAPRLTADKVIFGSAEISPPPPKYHGEGGGGGGVGVKHQTSSPKLDSDPQQVRSNPRRGGLLGALGERRGSAGFLGTAPRRHRTPSPRAAALWPRLITQPASPG